MSMPPLTLTRSLTTVILPGLVATTPWLLLLVLYSEKVGDACKKFPTVTAIAILGTSTVIGLIARGFLTWIEVRWDVEREEEYAVQKNWHAYLAAMYEPEPVGFRYLGSACDTLYFELGMMWALPSALIGMAIVLAQHPEFSPVPIPSAIWMILGFLLAAIIIFFLWQAKSTHEVLCSTRCEIFKRLSEKDLQKKIRERAYARWVGRGCPSGGALNDWLDAEKECRESDLS